MPDITVNIDIYCSCGEGLCNQTLSAPGKRVTGGYSSREVFVVEPCQKCMSGAKDDGYESGYNAAEKEHVE